MSVLAMPRVWIALALLLVVTALLALAVGRRRRPEASPAEPPTPVSSGPAGGHHRRDALRLDVPPPRPHPTPQPRPRPTAPADTPARATRLLRDGLGPAEVAARYGIDEHELAVRVAGELGLLPTPASSPGRRAAQDRRTTGAGEVRGTNRTVEPGRAWANAGSAAGSTTPTTG